MDNLPVADESNPDDIEWMFTHLPLSDSLPLQVQPKARKEWAQLFTAYGVRWHPELATKKLRHVGRGGAHDLNGLRVVLDVNDPDPEPIRVPDPEEMTHAEQAFMAERLRYLGRMPAPPHRVPAGERMDPAKHEAAVVLGYLMGCDEVEKRRVIAAEMTGLAREEILEKYRGV
ncbi:phage gene 29 protein family protein [Nocardia terpenica]|uniref:DUF2744 domain-containing protein n=1 Tax=Nocardia terpenica TaxID=455432 RepID=A0A6G9Z6Y1_9NOCA|nr:DUF2744 domain-containing protein [Nocardia terpenica]QIS21252.1 DUF2744 domain-containing protein [Nocardia terpenica]